MLKRLGRTKFAQEALGFLLATYIRLVRRTNRFILEPNDIDRAIAGQTPLIVAMWHGQHFMISYAWPRSIARMAALISRHGDGGVNAVALRRLGVLPIRGSGARAGRMRGKGGAPAMREMLRALSQGISVAITADIPKQARVAGAGIVMLARLSGRPIAPTAVVTAVASISSLGIAPASASPLDAARSSSATLSMSPPTPTKRRWNRPARRSRRGSTPFTRAPMQGSARPILAPV
jgi:lysophospholipid acyltransferase (LPLAT)-like uncharacterized protein